MKRMSIKKTIALFLSIIMAMSLLACGRNTSNSTENVSGDAANTGTTNDSAGSDSSSKVEPIYIAVIAPMTGDNQQYGEAFQKAIVMALEHINAAGGINGAEVICEYFDDKADQAESVTCAQKVVSEGKYFCVIGSQPSGCSMAIAPILKDAGMLQISPISSHPDYTSLSENAFTLNYTMDYCGPVWGDYIVDYYGSRRPAIIYSNDDYGVNVYNETSARLAEYGLEYVVAETYTTNSVKDYTSMLAKVKESGADLLCVRGPYADSAQIVIQARQLDLDIPISIDGQSANAEFLSITGEDSEGCTYVDTMFLTNPDEPFYSFANEYYEKYGELPTTAPGK